MRNVKSGYFLYIFWQGLGVGWLSSDSDSRLRLPSFSDSRLFPPKKPTNSRLPTPSPRQIFETEKISEIGSQIWESGVGHYLPTIDSLPLKIHRLPTPDSQALFFGGFRGKKRSNIW